MENYKLAFIHGRTDEKRNIKEGEIVKFGSKEENSLHMIHLLDYAKRTYPDVKLFNLLSNRHSPEIAGYFYTLLGDIVFFNTTHQDVEKYGKTGFLMLPKNMTSLQEESLYILAEEINDFEISIHYNITLEDGLLNTNSIQSSDKKSPRELLDIYFQQQRQKIKNK